MYAQLIDDATNKVITSLCTLEKANSATGKSFKNLDFAKKLGKLVADEAKTKGINTVVFDRGIYVYHGKIKAFADSARENGLKF